MNYNPLYQPGVLWKTRKNIKAYPEGNSDKFVFIPRGELVLLLKHLINEAFEEHIYILWKQSRYFVIDIDSAHDFDINFTEKNSKV